MKDNMNPFTWVVLIAGYVYGVYILVAHRGAITLLYLGLLVSILIITVIGLYVLFLEWRNRRAKVSRPISSSSSYQTEGKTISAADRTGIGKAVRHICRTKEEGRYGEAGVLVQISEDQTIRWVKDGVTVRTPGPGQSRPFAVNYKIGGKRYRYLTDLTAHAVNEDRRLYQDVHGRYVLDMKERYPVFDSYDAATENRYYHWYLILEEDQMSMIYSDDGSGEEITEDVDILPDKPYEILQFWHYLDENGILRL